MITNSDIRKMKGIFTTKEDLEKLKEAFVKKFATKTELMQTEKRLLNSIVEFKDSILKEIINLRDDVRVVIGYRDMLEDHEQRINKIERTVARS